jgi:TIR domain
VSWYSLTTAVGMRALCDGLVYVRQSDGEPLQIRDARPSQAGRRYIYRNFQDPGGVMFAIALPTGHGLGDPDPMPVEAKTFKNRVAVYWVLNQASDYVASWCLRELDTDTDTEVQRINGFIWKRLRGQETPEYDVALSYASEDIRYVEKVATALKEKGLSVFYDRDLEEAANLLGRNLYDYLTDIYRKRARFTVMFVSRHYAEKKWTNVERQSAQARAIQENREYILPARFDHTEVPGLLPTIAYADLETVSPEQLAETVREKLQAIRI